MSDRLITLLLVDDDPIFLLGLATALSGVGKFRILWQGNSQAVTNQTSSSQPDVIIIDPALVGWQICLILREKYPAAKICLLTNRLGFPELKAAENIGVAGYCPKGKTIEELESIIAELVKGNQVWQNLDSIIGQTANNPQWLWKILVSGLGQIEQSLTQVDIPLQYPQLSVFDRLFWSGRRRELLAARWLVRRLLPPIQSEVKFEPIANVSPPAVNLPVAIPTTSLTVASVLDNSLAKIQLGGENNTNYVLEIDILNAEKRRELLYIVFTQIRQIVNDLSLLNLDYQDFLDKIPVIIQKLWENSTRFFLEIYYPDKQKIRDGLIDEIILTNTLGVQQEILSKIPFLQELFAHIIYEMPVRVDNIEYNSQSPEAINRSEILLQNLIIQVSNAVVGLILNNFTEIEELTNTIYDRQLRSYREIARFRNTLSWQYRQLQYWEEPKAIFESKYRLFYLTERKIQQTFIEFPRQQELRQLKGIRWLVTIILEGRDAIAPRLRSVIALVGQGLVYVLTQVIGRGIGLIGRGIIQGVGRSIQK